MQCFPYLLLVESNCYITSASLCKLQTYFCTNPCLNEDGIQMIFLLCYCDANSKVSEKPLLEDFTEKCRNNFTFHFPS